MDLNKKRATAWGQTCCRRIRAWSKSCSGCDIAWHTRLCPQNRFQLLEILALCREAGCFLAHRNLPMLEDQKTCMRLVCWALISHMGQIRGAARHDPIRAAESLVAFQDFRSAEPGNIRVRLSNPYLSK
jgi:hypothetical protein